MTREIAVPPRIEAIAMVRMNKQSIRRRVTGLLVWLLVCVVVSFYGLRLVVKGARFHYLEREYAVNLQVLSRSLEQAATGDPEDKASVIKLLDYSRGISSHVDTDLFAFEHLVFRWMGFGQVIDLPYDSIRRVSRMKSRLEAQHATEVPKSLALELAPDLAELRRYGDEFAQEVAAAVDFVSVAVRVLIGLCLVLLGMSIWRLRRSLVGPLERAQLLAEAVAQGRLDTKTTSDGCLREDEIGALVHAVHRIQDAFREVVVNVSQCSHGVLLGSTEVAGGSADLSARTADQLARLQYASAATVQMKEALQSSAVSASGVNLAAGQALDKARQGGEVMQAVVQNMRGIADSSGKIASIVSVIDDIAFQTNLLALNASVEAARAGVSGRGFAVVAGEVRRLAGRVEESAREIKSLIGVSVENVENGLRLVDRAGRSMEGIVVEVDRVQHLIATMAAMVAQQSSGINEISEVVAHLETATQQNVALVEQSTAASQCLREQADNLCDAVAFFRLLPIGMMCGNEPVTER